MTLQASGEKNDKDPEEGKKKKKEKRKKNEKKEGAGPSNTPITTQPDPRGWHDGLFDCRNDVKNCVLTAVCCPCMVLYEYHLHGEFCGTALLMADPLIVLSAHYRGKQNIKGSLLRDCCLSTFCAPCHLCQLHRDFKAIKRSNASSKKKEAK